MSEQDQEKEVVIPSKEEILGISDEDHGLHEVDEVEYSEIEQQAMSMGWNPDKESVGDKWISAETFVAKAPLIDEMKKLKKAVNNRNKELDAMKVHLEMLRKKESEDAIKELKKQRREAMEMADYDAVDALEEQIDSVKQAVEKEEKEKAPANEVPQEYLDWKQENDWYMSDSELTKYADRIAPGLAQEYSDGDLEGLYNAITEEVRARYPEKFGKAPIGKPAASPVESSRRNPTGSRQAKAKHKLSDLPDEHRSIALTLIKAGHITEADYLKDYFGE